MLEIHPDLLWVGSRGDIREPRLLFKIGVEAVVDIAREEEPLALPRELIVCRFPLVDGEGNDSSMLMQAVQITVDLLVNGRPTLVACSAGRSRSPTIAAFALAAYLRQKPESIVSQLSKETFTINGQLWRDVSTIFSQIRVNT